ncbi:PAS domain-containing protein [Thalassospiraceae bacterium SW-3-3]|nr:PAS domain-containing protein [Thalassospiraceae bacterium SW-3-3]
MRSKLLIIAFSVIGLAMIGNLALTVLNVKGQLQRIDDDVNERVTGSLQGLQREIMALTNELLLTHHGQHVSSPQLLLRIDILASRLEMLHSGKVGEQLRQIPKVQRLLVELRSHFEGLDTKLSSGNAVEVAQTHPVAGTEALFIANRMAEIASQISADALYYNAYKHVLEQNEWSRFLRSIYIQLIIGTVTFAATIWLFVVLYRSYELNRRLVRREGDVKEAEEKFRLVVENINEIFWISNPNSDALVYLSPAFERISGQSPEVCINNPPSYVDCIHPDDQDRFLQTIQDRGHGGSVMEYRFLKPDGTIRWVVDRAFPVFGQDKNLRYFVGAVQDVTEIRQAEQALQKSEELFRLVTEITTDVIWERDLVNDKIWWSVGLLSVFGYKPENFQDQPEFWWDNIHPDDHERMRHHDDAILSGEKCEWTQEYRFRRYDGSYARVQEQGQVISGPDGKPQRIVGSIVDVTDRYNMEERALQSQRMEAIGQLTGGLAHDFNNLLQVILGNAELLCEEIPKNDRLHAMAHMTQLAAEKGALLTSRLLAFARRQVLEVSAIDIGKQIETMLPILRRTLPENIDLDYQPVSQPLVSMIDHTQLENAVLNLCINARDALPEGGTITIRVRKSSLAAGFDNENPQRSMPECAEITISDNGLGMTEDVRQHVFEPFFTTKEFGKGSGLGLSMVYGFVKQSGGHIEVVSKVGDGTAINIYVPCW